MRLHILSDLHTEGRSFTLPKVDADVLVLAGDIRNAESSMVQIQNWAYDRPVVYVAGNHEYYHGTFPKAFSEARFAAYGIPGLHMLNNNVWYTGDVRFLGCTLWTDFTLQGDRQKAMRDAEKYMRDYEMIRTVDLDTHVARHLLPLDTLRAHQDSVTFLNRQLSLAWTGKTVVVTHHMPSSLSIAEEYADEESNPAFASDLEYLFPSVDLWIHGHTHVACDYILRYPEIEPLKAYASMEEADWANKTILEHIHKTRVVCNPRGYERETKINGFNAEKVVEV